MPIAAPRTGPSGRLEGAGRAGRSSAIASLRHCIIASSRHRAARGRSVSDVESCRTRPANHLSALKGAHEDVRKGAAPIMDRALYAHGEAALTPPRTGSVSFPVYGIADTTTPESATEIAEDTPE